MKILTWVSLGVAVSYCLQAIKHHQAMLSSSNFDETIRKAVSVR
ncbi:hypothetical protein GW12_11080 [Acinetobacter sp. HR7]|nr:hypothetical protein GW12_11080 [Acinetobacter sp. HR7]